MGTLKKLDKAIDAATTAKIAALGAEGLEVVTVKGAWDGAINGALEPYRASGRYVEQRSLESHGE